MERFFFAIARSRVRGIPALGRLLVTAVVLVQRVGVDRAEVGLVARAGHGHLHERVDEAVGLHELAPEEVTRERRVLRGEAPDLLLPRDESIHALALLVSHGGEALGALLRLEGVPELLELRVPEEMLQPLAVRRMEQPQAFEAQRHDRKHRVQREAGRGECPAEERQVVRVREGHLQIGALVEDRAARELAGRVGDPFLHRGRGPGRRRLRHGLHGRLRRLDGSHGSAQ